MWGEYTPRRDIVMGNALLRHPLTMSKEGDRIQSVLSCFRQPAPSPLQGLLLYWPLLGLVDSASLAGLTTEGNLHLTSHPCLKTVDQTHLHPSLES